MNTDEIDELLIQDAPWLQANGDRTQLLVIRSVTVKDTDPRWQPVREYLDQHDQLTLADREVLPIPGMMYGRAEVSWYMDRTVMRDGMLAFKGPNPLRLMFASEIAEHALMIRQGFVFPEPPARTR
jgi:hypothetical protein